MSRQQLLDGLVQPFVCHQVGAVLHGVLLNRTARYPLRERRHALDSHLRVRRPRDTRLAVFLEPGNILGLYTDRSGNQQIALGESQQVLYLGAHLRSVDPV